MHLYRRPPEAHTKALLAACGLLTSDLEVDDLRHFFGCGSEDEPSGVVGLEFYGRYALLRSLAVSTDSRGQGCGRRLVAEAERYAVERGVAAIYLLTETAAPMFDSLGYEECDRDSAPVAIRDTAQFSSLCPASATFMVKKLVA